MPGVIGSLGAVAYDIIVNDRTGEGIGSATANAMISYHAFLQVGNAANQMSHEIQTAFLDFDKAMTEVKALGGLSSDEFNQMREAALDLSSQMPVTATDFANAMYLMVSVGYDYQAMMATIPEAAQLAVAGSMGMAEATNSIINVMGAYGSETYSAAEITKVFANAVGVGKYEMSDFMSEIMKNIGVASQLGISFSDLAAYNVALQNSFTNAEEAGTSFNRMLLTMTTTGAKAFKKLGISLTDSTGKFRDLTDIMADVKVKLDGVSNEQERLNILNNMFGTYGQRAAIALMNQADAMPELRKNMEEMDLIQTQFNTKLESTNSKLEIAENRMEAARIKLGEGMAPALTTVADLTGVLADALEDLPGPLQNVGGLAIYATGGLADLAPALMAIYAMKGLGLGGVISSIGTSLSGLGASLSGAATTAGTAIGGSIAAGVAIGAAAGLAGVWVLVKTGILDGISDIGRAIESSPLGSRIMDSLKIIMAPIGSLGAGIIALVKGDFEHIGEEMVKPFQQAHEAALRFKDAFGMAISGSGPAVQSLASAFQGLGQAAASGLGGLAAYASAGFSGIGGAFQGMAGQVRGVFSQLMSAIQGLINSTAGGFRAAGANIITSMVNGIVAAAGGIVTAIANALNRVRALFPFSPAKEGPLAETPNWGTWMSQGMEKAGPEAAKSATENLAAPVASAASPASAAGGGAGGPGGSGGGGSVNIAAGAIVINGAGQNAEEIANQVIAKLGQAMAGKRQQMGYRTTT